MTMIEFLYLFLFRALSGAQNGLGYADQRIPRTITSFLMCAILIGTLMILLLRAPESIWKVVAVLLVIASILGVLGVEDSYNEKTNLFKSDVHFWELLATGGITLAWMALGGNLIGIVASVYPGLILHKGFINLGSGQKWWYHGTDDKTGQTFSIPLLGWKIPRQSTRTRISLAVISVMIIIINTGLQWHVSLQQIIKWI